MSTYAKLKDLSVNFNAELQQISADLETVRIAQNYDDATKKKIRDISLILSKLRLLKGKEYAATQDVQERVQPDTNVIDSYEETAQNRILSDCLIKYACTNQAVTELMETQDGQLNDHQRRVKQSILLKHEELRILDSELLELDQTLLKKEDELVEARTKWDQVLGKLREMKRDDSIRTEENPLNEKMSTLLNKMELMRWLMSCLVVSPNADYDWYSDHDRLSNMLPMTRFYNTYDNIATLDE